MEREEERERKRASDRKEEIVRGKAQGVESAGVGE